MRKKIDITNRRISIDALAHFVAVRSNCALFVLLFASFMSQAQRMYSEEEIMAEALKVHPVIQAYSWNVESKSQLEKTAFSLPAPAISTQSPTGDFYALGINQNIDFPGVYIRQRNVLQAETDMARSQLQLTKQQLSWEVRTALADAKYVATQLSFLFAQDSLLQFLRNAANRQFVAGEIDFLEKSFVELQYGEVHQKLLTAQNESLAAIQKLRNLCGLNDLNSVSEFTQDELLSAMLKDATMNSGNAYLDVAKKEVLIADKMIKLERMKVMPGFQFGYLNQTERNSSFTYRWQAGITIPLWWWQYGGRIKASEANAKRATQNELAVIKGFENSKLDVMAQLNSASQRLNYYFTTGLKEAAALEVASHRFFEAGERNYTTHLRSMNDVLQVKYGYADAAFAYSKALAQFKFINGSN